MKGKYLNNLYNCNPEHFASQKSRTYVSEEQTLNQPVILSLFASQKSRTYVREEQTLNQRVILSVANNPVNCLRSRTRRKEGDIVDVGISYG